MFGWKQTRAALRDLRKDRSGVAAIEFAFIAGFLSAGRRGPVSDSGHGPGCIARASYA
jgi:hypothetical protein